MTVEPLFASGDKRQEAYIIPKDGSAMDASTVLTFSPNISGGIQHKDHRTYVDEKVEPQA